MNDIQSNSRGIEDGARGFDLRLRQERPIRGDDIAHIGEGCARHLGEVVDLGAGLVNASPVEETSREVRFHGDPGESLTENVVQIGADARALPFA